MEKIKSGLDTTKEVLSGTTTATDLGSKAIIKVAPKIAVKLSLRASNRIATIVPKVLKSFKVIGTATKALGGFLSRITGIVDLGLFIKEIVDDIASGKYGNVFWKTIADKKGLSKMVASLEVGYYINEILLEAEKAKSDWYLDSSRFLSETFGEEVSWHASQLDTKTWSKNFLEVRSGGFLPAISAIIASIASIIGAVGLGVSIAVTVAGLIKKIIDSIMYTAKAPKMDTHEERMSALSLLSERLKNAITDIKNMIELLDRNIDIDLSDKVQNSEVKNRLDYSETGKQLVEVSGVSYSDGLKEDIEKVESSTIGGKKDLQLSSRECNATS